MIQTSVGLCQGFLLLILLIFPIVDSKCKTDSDCHYITYSNHGAFCNRSKCECDDDFELDSFDKCFLSGCKHHSNKFCQNEYNGLANCDEETKQYSCLPQNGFNSTVFKGKCVMMISIGENCVNDNECQAGTTKNNSPEDIYCVKHQYIELGTCIITNRPELLQLVPSSQNGLSTNFVFTMITSWIIFFV